MSDAPPDEIPFNREAVGPAGTMQQISPMVRRLVAPNSGPFTFSGTCTYVLGRGHVAVIDPGPVDAAHLARLLDALAGETIKTIIATHTHRDHSPGIAALKEATGARVVGCAPHAPKEGEVQQGSHDMTYAPDEVLTDGARLAGAGFTLEAVATPGHADNHLAYALIEENALFSGDHVMAWSTTVVSPPDGSMRAYMASLDKLRARSEAIYWPGHGGPVTDPQRYMRALASHRRAREAAILQRLKAGDVNIEAIVERLYAGLDPRLKGGAARSVLAHLVDLVERGLVATDGAPTLMARYALA